MAFSCLFFCACPSVFAANVCVEVDGKIASAAEPVVLSGSSTTDLPDSPGSLARLQPTVDAVQSQTPADPQIAAKHKKTIQAGQAAVPWTAHDKMHYALRTATSPGSFAGDLASSGISHWRDSRPHFGTDRAGFGERLGATTYRSAVKTIFGTGILAAAFHDDPRYYALGNGETLQKRATYAATRVVIARKDDGSRAVNWPQLIAPVLSQGSVNGFYPSRDRDVTKTVTAILVSYAVTAGTNEASEFLGPVFRHLLHPF